MTTALLLIVGFLAGLLTIVSPCILPVLPAVIASGVSVGGRRRALAIASGLALAFGASALFSIRLLQALGLPLGLRYDIAIGVLFVLAAGFIVPRFGALLERPFARIGLGRNPNSAAGGLVLGATLGLLYLPCGGPILATIAAVGSPHNALSADAIGLTVAYSLGIALPILVLVLLTGRLTTTTDWLRRHAVGVRRVGGLGLAASAVAIMFGAATALQTAVPSYSASIEHHLTDSTSITDKIAHISNPHESSNAKRIHSSLNNTISPSGPSIVPMADQVPTLSAKSLPNYGKAPNFADVTRWINTPDGSALNLSQLRGHVVLVDFWTYSCINCLRSLPHVKAWYARYHKVGLDVVGVHTPEFDFEHVAGNVISAVRRLGITYPVAMDNNYGTWNAWGNNSWPAEYLIDAKGNVRYGSIGEGDYGTTEGAIRALLAADGAKLPPPTDVPDRTPQEASTPESYLGYERLARYVGTPIVKNQQTTYTFASSVSANHLSYGGQWTVGSQDIAAGANASIRIDIDASDVYLVLAGTGTVTATLNGTALPTQHVEGVPTLYTILSSANVQHGLLQLNVSPGVKAYDFTFG
ncbi:MAG TPA: cytochrome c biogenesis protein CcdA [Mycobacteriales bacterium]|nr:cytochrome c biogenesis protein CcdA [Mycobacteriales bacterium]